MGEGSLSMECAMWRKATGFAVVAGSSLAVLTGAQATELGFGPGIVNPTFTNTGAGTGGGTGIPADPIQLATAAQSGPASFDSLNGGTFTFSAGNMVLSGFDGTTYDTVTPNSEVFSAVFAGGDSLTGNVTITSVQDNNPDVNTLIGRFTTTAISGDPSFVDNFGGSGGQATFYWTINGNGTPISQFVAFDTVPLSLSTSELNPVSAVPLPPAIYLFGSVLGGAFWLGRSKRSAVSGLAAA